MQTVVVQRGCFPRIRQDFEDPAGRLLADVEGQGNNWNPQVEAMHLRRARAAADNRIHDLGKLEKFGVGWLHEV
jgi:hypothetical protein